MCAEGLAGRRSGQGTAPDGELVIEEALELHVG